MTDLQRQAVEQTKFWIDLANEIYGMSIPYPTVSFKLRGKTAGKAISTRDMYQLDKVVKKSEVRYNAVLLEENGDKFLNRTVPHEVAHIVQYHKYPMSRAHGYEWKNIMRDFGLTPSRCHSYDVSNSTVRRGGRMARQYAYKCGCRTHNLTVIRHRRVLKGNIYICKHCRESIKQVA